VVVTEAFDFRRRWWTLAVLCLSLMMVIMGNASLNLALPTLVRELHASTSELQWMVDAYSLAFAGLLFAGGALGDRFGRKGMLQLGLAIFGIASAIAIPANSATQIVVCRAMMGMGAALVMPATLSILANVFQGRERVRAISIWASISGVGSAIAPLTAGFLLSHFWWGSVFLANIPIVFLALIGGRFLVPTSRDPRGVPLDLVGAGFSIVAISSLVYGILEAPQRGWTDAVIVGAFVASLGFFVALVLWERRVEHPMLQLPLFRERSFTGGSVALFFIFFGMLGTFFMFTQYFQLVRGHSPWSTGLSLLPFAASLMTVALLSPRIGTLLGTRATVAIGLAVVSLGYFLLSRVGVSTGYSLVLVALVVMAGGMGLTTAPSTTAIMSALPLAKAGVGSAMNDTTRELGGALGVAVMGSLLASRFRAGLDMHIAALSVAARTAARSSVGGALGVAHQLKGAAGVSLTRVARESFTTAMGDTLVIAAVVTLLAAAVISMALPGRPDLSPRELDRDTKLAVASEAAAL